MTVDEVVAVLELYFPLSLQEGWDNSGLQISKQDNIIKGVLLSLDVGMKTIIEAKDNNCDLVIAHHPLLFKSTKKIYSNVYPYNVIQEAIKNNICVYAFHTNLDIAKNGLNDRLCKMLKLQNIHIIENTPPLRIGELEKEIPLDKAIEYIKNTLGVNRLKYTDYGKKTVKKIAVCSGSCADMVYDIKEQFDLFLTGDLKHHTAFYAKESGINIVDATHFYTEICSKYILADILSEKLKNVEIVISKSDELPWKYK